MRTILTSSLFLILFSFSYSQNINLVSNTHRNILEEVYSMVNYENRPIDEMIAYSDSFELVKERIPNFGLINTPIILRFTITNNTGVDDLFLELGQPILDYIEFYDFQKSKNPIRIGDIYPFDVRTFNHIHFVFDLNIPQGETKTYYLQVFSSSQLQLPIYIGERVNIEASNLRIQVLLSVFFGVMVAMILYNLVIYFFVKDISYVYYVIYISILAVTQLVPQGYAFQHFWPNQPWLATHSMMLFPVIVGVSGIFFFNSFLNTKKYLPRISMFFRIVFVLYTIGLILMFTDNFNASYGIIDFTALSVALIMLIGASIIYRRGNKTAIYFLIAWSIFLVGIVLWVLKDVGILPYNFITNNVMILGAGIETILLSIGLANRINILKKEKETSRHKELVALQKNEMLIREQKSMLEQQVKERTEELMLALESIKKAQDKLIESEKMASIGQLTAGIAHEINNPINYVTSNIASLDRDLAEIQGVIKAYSEIDDTNFSEKIKEIEILKTELDFDYLQEEIPMLLEGIKEGANRTANIVSSLRVFSNKDKKRKSLVDMTVGINSSITLLSNKLDDIEVITNYELDKEVYCFPGKLNQVFMNILANAIDAIRERQSESSFKGLISVHVFEKEDHFICVTIEDNGIGMDEETKKKIFDPFFSSKDVGAGTGLGMSLTYQFIKLHSGEIKIDSTLNQGTKITVCIKNVEDYE